MRYLGAVKLSVANFFCQKSVVDEITTSIKGGTEVNVGKMLYHRTHTKYLRRKRG